MKISINCLQCARSLAVPEALAGKRVKCPGCGGAIYVTAPLPSIEPLDDLLDDAMRPAPPAPPIAESPHVPEFAEPRIDRASWEGPDGDGEKPPRQYPLIVKVMAWVIGVAIGGSVMGLLRDGFGLFESAAVKDGKQFFNEMVVLYEELHDVLTTIDDRASAEAAVRELERIVDTSARMASEGLEIQKRFTVKNFERLKKWHRSKIEPQLKDLGVATSKEANRIQGIPEASQTLRTALDGMANFRADFVVMKGILFGPSFDPWRFVKSHLQRAASPFRI